MQSRSANARGGAPAAGRRLRFPAHVFADTAAQNELCGPSAVIDASFFTKRNHMNWIYWDTAWSLFFSLVWFMTITHFPDAQIADAHSRDEGFGGRST
ncbi:MAG: hypothetical protein E6G93_17455 [Alphaproteobacteria bacterium]|nr:MAG: hypothetical protein E6G93_17455 [Alphaproteobacteria bacterium]